MSLFATPSGTDRYRQRFAASLSAEHFRAAQRLWMSSLGLGTYLGQPDATTDAAYQASVKRALALGCNVIDTAANYRFQRSERSIGAALKELPDVPRDEFVVTTKGGFVPFDGAMPRSQAEFQQYLNDTFINTGIAAPEDFVNGQHCMTPRYLSHQLNQSLRNLQLDAVDVYYLHNPESQFAAVEHDEFYQRLRTAFEFLESAVASGKIAFYGTATWNGYRVPTNSHEHLSLERVVQTARDIAGEAHHCRVIQLPINLAMTEAFTHANQSLNGQQVTLLEASAALGVTVMTSGSLMQAQLTAGLPPVVAEAFPGLATDAQRALQFVRSTPGVTTALVGMSNVAHVEENLALARTAPATAEQYLSLFSKA
ncbi:MAG: aldo/keto reductase [Acidobacteria bacterium]|nr:aldo/keto reductase [Acidobacteriota bacterium]